MKPTVFRCLPTAPILRCLAVVFALGMASLDFANAAEKDPPTTAESALEPMCATIEPRVLRTELARPLGDGKQTVVIPAREDNVLGLSHLSRGELAATGLNQDEFMAKAAAAATRLLLTLNPEVTKDKDGSTAYVTLRSERPFASSIVLSPRLLPLFKEQFGDRLVVLVPDRNTVYVFSRNFGKFQDFGPRIIREYHAALYPASLEAFEISRDGIKCLGGFDTGNNSPPAPSSNSTKSSPAPPDPPKSAKSPPSSKPSKPSKSAGKK